MITPEVLLLAQQLWDYHHMNHELAKSDCILALGSHDLRVADRAAELYLEGWAPLVIMSGGLGNFTQDMLDGTRSRPVCRDSDTKRAYRLRLFLWKTSPPIPGRIFYLHSSYYMKKSLTRKKLHRCTKTLYGKKVLCYFQKTLAR